MLATAEFGRVPELPSSYYLPMASEPGVVIDPSVQQVPFVRAVVEDIAYGVLPSPHNAGIVSSVQPDPEQDVFELDDLSAIDLVALRLDRFGAKLLPTDRRGVAKGSGAIAIEGVVAVTNLSSGLVTITHVPISRTAWTTSRVPSLPASAPRQVLRPLGLDAIQLEVTGTDPEHGIAELKRRIPVY